MKEFISIFRKTTEELANELDKIATLHGHESWLFLPQNPEGKVCLVGHIDTVFDRPQKLYNPKGTTCLTETKPKQHKKKIFFDNKQGVLWSPDGLGGDDRAGVWACMDAFNNIPEPYKPIVLLTDGEETGGTGAREAVELFGEILAKANFFIELDRKGKGEAVFYNYEPEEFAECICDFGFRESMGSFSDVSIICPAVERCGANLSIGYHNAHQQTEYLSIPEMKYTTDRIIDILKDNHEAQKVWELDCSEYMFDMFDEWDDFNCPKCREWLTYHDLEAGFCAECGTDLTQKRDETRRLEFGAYNNDEMFLP